MSNLFRQGDIRHNFADISLLGKRGTKFINFSRGLVELLEEIKPRLQNEQSSYLKSRDEAIKSGILKHAK